MPCIGNHSIHYSRDVPMKILRFPVLFIFCIAYLTACNSGDEQTTTNTNADQQSSEIELSSLNVPVFNADSAYHYINKQVSFGPRVPNTSGHKACGDWLHAKLDSFTDEVTVQKTTVTAYDGTDLNIRNFIGSINPENNKRILLFAHWDTRHMADFASDRSQRDKPIPGANDGGSGVGVLLEIARQLEKKGIDLGVDIIFFDAEDYGQPSSGKQRRKQDTWCLGSQYWSRNPHQSNYNPHYGILLDMVGAQNSNFTMEEISRTYAPQVMRNVWDIANQLNHSNYFVYEKTGPVTDDHYYVNRLANIPSINIIHRVPSSRTGFGSFWHTHEDDMAIIHKPTLQAVGETVLHTLYLEEKKKGV